MLLVYIVGLSAAIIAAVVFLDVYTNPEYVAERRAHRDQQVWMQRHVPTQHFPRYARNTHRHRRVY